MILASTLGPLHDACAPLVPAYTPPAAPFVLTGTDRSIRAHLRTHRLCGRGGIALGINRSREVVHARLRLLIAAGLVEQMQTSFKGRGGARKLYAVAAGSTGPDDSSSRGAVQVRA